MEELRSHGFTSLILSVSLSPESPDRRGDPLHRRRQRLHHPLHRKAPLTAGEPVKTGKAFLKDSVAGKIRLLLHLYRS